MKHVISRIAVYREGSIALLVCVTPGQIWGWKQMEEETKN